MSRSPALAAVVAGGDQRASLEALRDRLAAAVDFAEPRELAPLARQLSLVLAEIAALPDASARNPINEIAERAAAKRALAESA